MRTLVIALTLLAGGCGGVESSDTSSAAVSDEAAAARHGHCRVRQVSAGFAHACAVRADHTLWCWGDNSGGALGLGTIGGFVATPTRVSALGYEVRSVEAGDAGTCAIALDGSLWCWGDFQSGAPVRVHGIAHVEQVALGSFYQCAVTRDHRLSCFGPDLVVKSVPGLDGRDVVEVGTLNTTCARKLDGSLWCWGDNSFGDAGVGSFDPVPVPARVTALRLPVVEIAAGGIVKCARTIDQKVYCWGINQNGDVGIGTNVPSAIPTPAWVAGLGRGVVQLTTRTRSACALELDGTPWCWALTALGDGSNIHDVPTRVDALAHRVLQISAGEGYFCALDVAGRVQCSTVDAIVQEPIPSTCD